jgi:hypothetical protein
MKIDELVFQNRSKQFHDKEFKIHDLKFCVIFYLTVLYSPMTLENVDCVTSKLFAVSKFP